MKKKYANGGMAMAAPQGQAGMAMAAPQGQAGMARAMPAKANKGGAMRGQARAAEMSGRTFADGGMVDGSGCGHRSAQDYGKKGK